MRGGFGLIISWGTGTMTILDDAERAVGMPERKRLFLIDMVAKRAQQLAHALSPMYEVQTFSEGSPALDAMYKSPPDLVIIDEKTMSTQGQGIHRTKVRDSNLKHIPFIIMSNATAGELLLGDGDGAADHFMKRPIDFKMLLEQVSYSLSQSTERSWDKLQKSAKTTLKSTVEDFKKITKAIAAGELPDLKETNEACKPLVECVQSGGYNDMLDGLREHHNYTYVHSLRVATYLTVFGKAVGMGEGEM